MIATARFSTTTAVKTATSPIVRPAPTGIPAYCRYSSMLTGIASAAMTKEVHVRAVTMNRIAPGPDAIRAALSALKFG